MDNINGLSVDREGASPAFDAPSARGGGGGVVDEIGGGVGTSGMPGAVGIEATSFTSHAGKVGPGSVTE